MQDLNDLYYFAMVVDHGGFAAAERALGIPKSRLSRRISQLETDLGVRLLQRSTRRFAVTDVGNSVYRHAQSMLAEAQAAHEVVDRLSAEPRGVIRVSVPVGMAQQQMPRLLPEFLARYPQVRVQLLVSNRRVDIINEGIDVALRVRTKLDDDGSLVMRSFGQIQELLVASPDYLRAHGPTEEPGRTRRPRHPEHERGRRAPALGAARPRWRRAPRRAQAARDGFRFPDADGAGRAGRRHHAAAGDRLRRGRAPRRAGSGAAEWRLPQGIFHAVFASRRGLLPAVRVFIDFLAEKAPGPGRIRATAVQGDQGHAVPGRRGTPVPTAARSASPRKPENERSLAPACDNARPASGSRASQQSGEMAEWFKAAVLKTAVVAIPPWVRIPLSPPNPPGPALRRPNAWLASRSVAPLDGTRTRRPPSSVPRHRARHAQLWGK